MDLRDACRTCYSVAGLGWDGDDPAVLRRKGFLWRCVSVLFQPREESRVSGEVIGRAVLPSLVAWYVCHLDQCIRIRG